MFACCSGLVPERCQPRGTRTAATRACYCRQPQGLRIVLPDIFAKPWLQPTLAAFSSLHGVLLDIDVWPAVRLHEALVAEAVTGGGCITAGGCIADGSNSTAGAPAALLLHTVGSTHDLASGGILADLRCALGLVVDCWSLALPPVKSHACMPLFFATVTW